ncbi:MAG TPA: IS1182 family transposase [Terracidiphilus sp.]
MSKRFRPCSLEQDYLLPPSLDDWLPEDHLARFIGEISETLDLTEIYLAYERKDGRGLAAYHPLMLTRLLLYGYCIGVRSSRRIERATYDDVAFRYLAANQHPDHDTIANFRRTQFGALANLFVQALQLCQRAGLVRLGVVALDGTKILANASGLRSMKYQALQEEERRLAVQVASLLAEAEKVDEAEDAQWGEGQREAVLPPGLERAQARLVRLRQAREELEREAQARLEEAERKSEPGAAKPSPEEREKQKQHRKRARANARCPQRSYNFTDPEARQMLDNGTKRIITGYNGQLAVDVESQIIIAAEVTQQVHDRQQLVPMAEQVVRTGGVSPRTLLADAGYWDTLSLRHPVLAAVDVLIAPDAGGSTGPRHMFHHPLAIEMRQRLQTAAGRALYRLRKTSVEPVIGRIKEHRRFRRFSLRGLANAAHEWKLVCLTHNLLKLHRLWRVATA